MTKIVICYLDTGGGHRQAAKAIAEALREVPDEQQGPLTVIEQGELPSSNRLNSMFLNFYNFLLRHHQEWMKYYFAFIEWAKPNESRLAYRMSGDSAKTFWRQLQPDVVVSVHPMLNHYTYWGLKDAGLVGKTKFAIVLTDPNAGFWSGWACRDADLNVAPNSAARDRLVALGILPERIRTIGMPVRSAFCLPPKVDATTVLARLGLEQDRLTVLLSGGWAGGGEIEQIFRALTKVKRRIQVVVICGHNALLLARINALRDMTNMPFAALPFTDSMSDLMWACDLMITKGGGLTTSEAVARRLPLVLDMIHEPMPQELGTVQMLVESGKATGLKSVDDIIEIVENFQKLNERPLPSMISVHEIARAILSLSDRAGQ